MFGTPHPFTQRQTSFENNVFAANKEQVGLPSIERDLSSQAKVHFEISLPFNNLRASIHELNKEEFSRKRSFSFDREQRLSRRESLANINTGNAVNLENENLIAEIEECRRDSLSESHEVIPRVNQLPLA